MRGPAPLGLGQEAFGLPSDGGVSCGCLARWPWPDGDASGRGMAISQAMHGERIPTVSLVFPHSDLDRVAHGERRTNDWDSLLLQLAVAE